MEGVSDWKNFVHAFFIVKTFSAYNIWDSSAWTDTSGKGLKIFRTPPPFTLPFCICTVSDQKLDRGRPENEANLHYKSLGKRLHVVQAMLEKSWIENQLELLNTSTIASFPVSLHANYKWQKAGCDLGARLNFHNTLVMWILWLIQFPFMSYCFTFAKLYVAHYKVVHPSFYHWLCSHAHLLQAD